MESSEAREEEWSRVVEELVEGEVRGGPPPPFDSAHSRSLSHLRTLMRSTLLLLLLAREPRGELYTG
jgi:hypothetical protein